MGLALPASGVARSFPAEIELASIELDKDALFGFVMHGLDPGEGSGRSVSAAGDVNGDGIDDLIIGAPDADPNGMRSGRSYVVFGNSRGFTNPFELSALNGQNGFILNGEPQGVFGWSVSAAGDVNSDGIDDLIIGDLVGAWSGRSYVVFGSNSGFPSPFNMSTLNGQNGFTLKSDVEFERIGWSVSSAGDVNDDGIHDLLIGARGSPAANANAGRTYVIYGSTTEFPHPLNLSAPNTFAGSVMKGEAFSLSGDSVSPAGDINGDGFDDLIIGAPGSSYGEGYEASSRSYVVFGSGNRLPNPLELPSINGPNGFVLNSEGGGRPGATVSAAGDINGDGIDDLIIGARSAEVDGDFLGRSYVVFGSRGGHPNPFELSSLNGSNGFVIDGFVIDGESGFTNFGGSVSAAGDVNGDGIDDLIIGASSASFETKISAGRSYVVFGKSDGFPNPLTLDSLDGSNGFRINGAVEWGKAGFYVSAAGDINGDGIEDLIIGAPSLSSDTDPGRSYVIFGRGDGVFSDRFQMD
jgi:hypothetical protein